MSEKVRSHNIMRYLVRTCYWHPVLVLDVLVPPMLAVPVPVPGCPEREERHHCSSRLLHRVESLLRPPLGHGKERAQAAQTGKMKSQNY